MEITPARINNHHKKWIEKLKKKKFVEFLFCFSHEYKQKHDVRQYSSEARQLCLYYFSLSHINVHQC